MRNKVNKYPGLYREDFGSAKARYRILINHKKKQVQEYFTFDNSSDEKRARRAAIKRWKVLREKYPVLTKRDYRELSRRPSSSGLTGVRRVIKQVAGSEYESWTSTWTDARGNRKTKSFSVSKYGERKAKRLAVKARRDALDLISAK